MSAWSDARDAFERKVGIPTGIDLGGAKIPSPTSADAGAAAGTGIIELGTIALSNLFRPSAAGTAATGAQATANTVAKISVPVLIIGGIAAYLLLRKKG